MFLLISIHIHNDKFEGEYTTTQKIYIVIKINTFTSDKALINKTTTQFIVSNFLPKRDTFLDLEFVHDFTLQM